MGTSVAVVSVLSLQVINKCRFTFALWAEQDFLLRSCAFCASGEESLCLWNRRRLTNFGLLLHHSNGSTSGFFIIIILNHPSSYEEGLERDQNVDWLL